MEIEVERHIADMQAPPTDWRFRRQTLRDNMPRETIVLKRPN
jgi:hypothetical protein